ncbi:glycosyltransferase [Thermosulfuriphilus sp.]
MTEEILLRYREIAGADVVDQLKQLAGALIGARVIHVNSTRYGGGVAEILNSLTAIKEALGLNIRWEVISGDENFFRVTKAMHNALQGFPQDISESALRVHQEINAQQAEILRPVLEDADFVFIHDPQPAPLIEFFPHRKGKWIWRCHIDLSRPHRPVWRYLRDIVSKYDATIFSMPDFTQPLPNLQYIIPPSIDPLSPKNVNLDQEEVDRIFERFKLTKEKPLIVQVSRFDRFKDPLGVIRAVRLARKFTPVQLVLAGGGAADDPEGEIVLKEVKAAALDDPDIRILFLPPDEHLTINALQRAADVIMQKSIKEGFGLTVTEGMWKGKPVIGGDTGGIRSQVVNHHTGFLVRTPEGAALRIRYLLSYPERRAEMGRKAREFVRDNFLITRHVRDYLSLMLALLKGSEERIELAAE